MIRHPFFDLWLHTTEELANLLGVPVQNRVTLHEWPLSCVERITTAGGKTWIYKSQAQPTVEPEFYCRARSPILVEARVLPGDNAPPALLLEDFSAPNLEELSLNLDSKLAWVDKVLSQIAQIEGDFPVLLDLCSPERWRVHAQAILDDLGYLAAHGVFTLISTAVLDKMSAAAFSPNLLALFSGPTGLVHGDLSGENILVTQGCQDRQLVLRVLDWQRPIWGPPELDRATLLTSLGIDPATFLSPAVLDLRILLLIGWFAQCARTWFPAGASAYDAEVDKLASQLSSHQAS